MANFLKLPDGVTGTGVKMAYGGGAILLNRMISERVREMFNLPEEQRIFIKLGTAFLLGILSFKFLPKGDAIAVATGAGAEVFAEFLAPTLNEALSGLGLTFAENPNDMRLRAFPTSPALTPGLAGGLGATAAQQFDPVIQGF